MRTGFRFACAAVFAAASCAAGAAEFGMDVSLKDLSLGQRVMGPPVKVEGLPGHVVLVEFWGVNCPPCRESLPVLSRWSKKHAGEGLIVIGIHAQNASSSEIESLCQQKGVNFSIFATGQVRSGMDFSGIPHAFLFDHTGRCIYRGGPMSAYDKIKAALAKAPAAVLGGRELVKLKSLSDAMKKGMPPALAIKAANEKLSSEDAETAEEAKFVVERVISWGRQQVEDALAAKETEPLYCYTTLQKIAKDFDGTDVGKDAATAVNDMQADEAVMKEVKAWQVLERIGIVEKGIKPLRSWDGADITSDKFKKKNAVPLRQIIDLVKRMRKAYPDSEATRQAEDILTKYGFAR
ncbi:MAG TPA: TlpA disulfide reductase family protein [Planctomycetota bacterium]|nr:TlpA disulfide reductase family protein [Planctomycetota bacterium]